MSMARNLTVSLGKGLFTYTCVDEDDYKRLKKHRWRLSSSGYAVRTVRVNGTSKHLPLHREIMDARPNELVDHVNRDKLDNRKNNLRLVNHSDNSRNRGPKSNTRSSLKGVSWDNGAWRATIRPNGVQENLGRYTTKEAAARAYNEKALEYYGEFAYLNPV